MWALVRAKQSVALSGRAEAPTAHVFRCVDAGEGVGGGGGSQRTALPVLLLQGRRLGWGQECNRREGTSEATPAAVRQAVGGGCQSGWGRLLSVTNAIEAGTWRQGDSGWALGLAPWRGGGSYLHLSFHCIPGWGPGRSGRCAMLHPRPPLSPNDSLCLRCRFSWAAAFCRYSSAPGI